LGCADRVERFRKRYIDVSAHRERFRTLAARAFISSDDFDEWAEQGVAGGAA
jgi:hypothetical protein